MILQAETLPADLLAYASGGSGSSEQVAFATSEIGLSVLQLAAERVPQSLVDSLTTKSVDVFAAARMFVAKVMLSSTSDHFLTMGVPQNFQDDELRENYRRLIALVHPDVRPEGFPKEAASKVNLAYSTLSNSMMRVAYVAALNETNRPANIGSAFSSTNALRSREGGDKRATAPGRIRSLLMRRPQFRMGLLIVATVLVAPVAVIVVQTFSQPQQSRLVEARPKRTITALLDDAISRTLQPEPELDSTANQKSVRSAPLKTEALVPLAAGTQAMAPPRPVPPLILNLVPLQLSERPSPVEAAAEVATLQQRGLVQQTVEIPTAGASSLPPQLLQRAVEPLSPPPETSTRSTSSATTAIQYADLDDVLLRFASAYESGSATAFDAIFAPGMQARRAFMTDYSKLFQTTRQRQIRFAKLRHAGKGDHVTTTGYVNVSSIDLDNVATNQRVFIEIDTRRIDGAPRIERLNSYVIQ